MELRTSTINIVFVLFIWIVLVLGCGDNNDMNAGGLPVGKYQCATTVAIYGSGGMYNFSYQVRDKFEIFGNGTYKVNEDTAPASYSYDAATGNVQWNGEAFDLAKKSTFAADKGIIYVQMGNENWDCSLIKK